MSLHYHPQLALKHDDQEISSRLRAAIEPASRRFEQHRKAGLIAATLLRILQPSAGAAGIGIGIANQYYPARPVSMLRRVIYCSCSAH
jgi:hypothetical protein